MPFLIIDGHGATAKPQKDALTFDFRRTDVTKCSLYSYTKEGVNIGVDRSNRIIATSINGVLYEPLTAERSDSRMGGTRVLERLLQAKNLEPGPGGALVPQWDTPVPLHANHLTIYLRGNTAAARQVPVECYFVAAPGAGGAVNERTADIVVIYITPGHRGQLTLSTILDHFNEQPYNVIWAPCRGY